MLNEHFKEKRRLGLSEIGAERDARGPDFPG
jgi:hypothetical protein